MVKETQELPPIQTSISTEIEYTTCYIYILYAISTQIEIHFPSEILYKIFSIHNPTYFQSLLIFIHFFLVLGDDSVRFEVPFLEGFLAKLWFRIDLD